MRRTESDGQVTHRRDRGRPSATVPAAAALLLLLVHLAAVASYAQDAVDRRGGIAGLVLDRSTGAPVAGATVRIPERALEIRTDAGGRFTVVALAPGAVRIEAARLGYRSHAGAAEIRPGEMLRLRIELEPEPAELEEITATVERRRAAEERRRGTRIDVVTRDQIESQKGARHVGDLVRGLPGLSVSEAGQGGIVSGLCIESSRILFRRHAPEHVRRTRRNPECEMVQVYVDAMPVMDPANYLSSLRPQEIESIEFIPPVEAIALFGRRAATGALLITTRWN